MPEAIGSVYGLKEEYLPPCASRRAGSTAATPRSIGKARKISISCLHPPAPPRRRGGLEPRAASWIAAFEKDPMEAGLDDWFEIRKGIDESLRDFF